MTIKQVENSEGRMTNRSIFEIVEVAEGSNAEKAGIKVGDTLRACNATVAR